MRSTSLAPFAPPRWLSHPWAQTLYPQFFPLRIRAPLGESLTFPTTLGDKVTVAFDHLENRDNEAGVLLLHGLCGSQDSRYIVRLSHALSALGVVVGRMNMRGCGPSLPLAKHVFHSGRSEDLAAVVNALPTHFPNKRWLVVGFSLGGNVVLKYMGEAGVNLPTQVAHALAVSPPTELAHSAAKLGLPENRLLNRYFVRGLVRHARALARTHGEPEPVFPKVLDLRRFDEMYTAPRAGYPDALAYYHGASAARVIDRITGPSHILFADDDPVIDTKAVAAIRNPHVTIDRVAKGGHVAFIGTNANRVRATHWMDEYICALASQHLNLRRAEPKSLT